MIRSRVTHDDTRTTRSRMSDFIKGGVIYWEIIIETTHVLIFLTNSNFWHFAVDYFLQTAKCSAILMEVTETFENSVFDFFQYGTKVNRWLYMFIIFRFNSF